MNGDGGGGGVLSLVYSGSRLIDLMEQGSAVSDDTEEGIGRSFSDLGGIGSGSGEGVDEGDLSSGIRDSSGDGVGEGETSLPILPLVPLGDSDWVSSLDWDDWWESVMGDC
jgi:hypothetical protein